MNSKLYYKLWLDAKSQPNKEMYINEYGYPDWFDEISTDPDEVVSFLGEIHDKIWTPFKDILDGYGLSKAEFSRRFCIPIRTVEDWYSGKRKMPEWAKKLIIEKLEIMKETGAE